MGFTSTLKLYREGPPPVVTSDMLASFIERWQDSGAGTRAGTGFQHGMRLKMKFGKSVDHDAKRSFWVRWKNAYIGEIKDIAWDVEETPASFADMMRVLRAHPGTIYRAYLGLDEAVATVIDPSVREPSTENSEPFVLSDWSFEVGPIDLSSMGTDLKFRVGWLALSLHGNGYPFPWSFADVYRRMLDLPELVCAKRLCENAWPVEPRPTTRAERKKREAMKELWPYPTADHPLGWQWGLRA